MKILKDIIDIDKRLYKKILFYNLVLFVVFYAVMGIFNIVFTLGGKKLESMVGVSNIATLTVEQAEAIQPSAVSFLWFIIFMMILFILIELYNYMFFENLIWNTIFNKKTTFKNTNKFFVLNIILALIFALIIGLMFLIISRLPQNIIVVGVALFYVLMIFCGYLLFIGYISFGKTHLILKSVKNAFDIGIKKLNLTIIPLVITFVIGLVINLVFILINWFNPIVVQVLQTLVFTAYLCWFRLYLLNSLKSVKF